MTIIILMLVMIICMITIRLGAIAFEITGMPRSKSIFQAVSCYTQTGFTTSESEFIVSDPRRRKIALFLMLFGNASSVTMIAALAGHLYKILDPSSGLTIDIPYLSIHLELSQHGHSIARIIELCTIAGGSYYFFMHSTSFSAFLDFVKRRIQSEGMVLPLSEIPLDTDGQGIFVLFVRKNSKLNGQTTEACAKILSESDIAFVSIVRDGKLIRTPESSEKICYMDKIVCIGQEKIVCDFDITEAVNS